MGRVPIRRGGSSAPPVLFDSYTKAQLQAILLSERPADANENLYHNFVASVLPLYTATCKSLHELRALLGPLWRRYAAPWGGGQGTTGTRRRRREARRFQSPNRRRKATPNGTRTPGRVSPNRDISSRCSSLGTPRRRSLEEARRGLPARDRARGDRGRARCFTRVSRCLSPRRLWRSRAGTGPCPRTRAWAPGSWTSIFRG